MLFINMAERGLQEPKRHFVKPLSSYRQDENGWASLSNASSKHSLPSAMLWLRMHV